MHYPVRYMNQAFSRSFSLSHKASRPCFSFGCIILFLWVIGVGWTAPAPNPNNDTYPPTVSLDELAKEIDKAPATHPRLLATQSDFKALRESLDQDPLRRLLADAVIKQANALENAMPVERKLQGRRLLGVSRRCLQRTVTLAMAYHLTGSDKYVRRCKQEMLAAARFGDWNPKHFLDVAEMTFALAIGYDWLFDQLDKASRVEIRQAIVNKGVNLPFTTRHKGWVRARNNWGQVCHGGLTAGALAILEDEPELTAKTVHSALQNVTYSMAAYAPKGSYPEGPGYWNYGTIYNVMLIGMLESALGNDHGLSKAPGFNETGQYLSLAGGPSGLFFNYADGGATRGPSAALFWFASRYNRPDWLLGEHDRLRATLAELISSDGRSWSGRFLPMTLLWMKGETGGTEYKMPLHWLSKGETPIAVHRSSWTDPEAVFVGFKAGSPSANHGQMDTGSFVLDSEGLRWAVDLGAEGYHGIESRGMNLWSRSQNSDRWTIFRQQNHGHNTLVIDDQLQVAKGHSKIVKFSNDPDSPYSIADLTPVYAGQAKTIWRGVALLPSGEVLIQDELEGLRPGGRVRWGMVTPGTPNSPGQRDIELRQSGKSLVLTLRSSNKDATWRIIDTAKPRNEWDSPNLETRMVAFESIAPKSGELTMAVLLTPGSCANSVRGKLRLMLLQEW